MKLRLNVKSCQRTCSENDELDQPVEAEVVVQIDRQHVQTVKKFFTNYIITKLLFRSLEPVEVRHGVVGLDGEEDELDANHQREVLNH